jgi:hypothetical protein
MDEKSIQFSIRLKPGTYRRLKFIAADLDEPLNKVVSPPQEDQLQHLLYSQLILKKRLGIVYK